MEYLYDIEHRTCLGSWIMVACSCWNFWV